MRPTKRTLLLGGLLASAAPARFAVAEALGSPAMTSAADDLKTYIDFGVKASGGAGDNDSGAWLEKRLIGLGFTVERQPFDVPYFEATATRLSVGAGTAPVVPLMPVTPTGPGGIEGPLAAVAANATDEAAFPAGSIVAILLPYRRWSTAAHPLIQGALATCFARGAAAALLVTTGPTDQAIALNVPSDAASYRCPVAVIGPADLAPLLKRRATSTARLELSGHGARRPAFNIIATMNRERASRIVVSTPRSGWGICAGERGPGVAAFLDLARWLSERAAAATLVCTSGHEYENLGGKLFLHEQAQKPEAVSLWVHLGANLAARDWHETGRALLPLPSADPQRFLMVSRELLPSAQAAFAGLPGLENPYELSSAAQGELKEIHAANYTRVMGVFGAHRYHHTLHDDERAVNAALVPPATAALQKFVSSVVR